MQKYTVHGQDNMTDIHTIFSMPYMSQELKNLMKTEELEKKEYHTSEVFRNT